MESLEEYRRDLIDQVQTYASEEGVLDYEAFFNVTCDILRDSEVIVEYAPAHYLYGENTKKFMLVSGYDFSSYDQDESIVIIGCDSTFSLSQDEEMPTIQTAEYKKKLRGMRNFVLSALTGDFLKDAEESSDIYSLAQFIHDHRDAIRRVRLYFITDRQFTGSDANVQFEQDLYAPSTKERGIGLEAHMWDLQRLRDESESTGSTEHLIVNLDAPGIPAVHAPVVDTNMNTYLLFLTGDVLAKLYKDYGAKLMEANVRSFLSMRGKVNKGIRNTILTAPDRFVAYNNGLTATASSLTFNEQGNIVSIEDLQIVNGGQTTASIYYTGSNNPQADLSKIVVPVKLVVVDAAESKNLVPEISRFTNSQNKVAEADFSSNSEYQVKMERASRTVLTPLKAGKQRTRWYYERVRGQYDNEKSRLHGEQRKAFIASNPTRQRIKMVDAPKYLMCWQGFPEIASLGAQKCFAKFAEETNDEKIIEGVNVEYFKELVCKRIIFDSTHKNIKKMDWYLGAYQMNIAEYAVAKYSYDLYRAKLECDFDEIWEAQAISPEMLACLMRAAKQASDVINDSNRPVANCSEWAKHTECWEELQTYPSCLDAVSSTDALPVKSVSGKPESENKTTSLLPISNDDNPQEDVPSFATKEAEQPLTPAAPPTSSSPVQEDSAMHVAIERDVLDGIPADNWKTFMRWCEHRQNIDPQDYAPLSKLERHIALTDEDVDRLWNLRLRAIDRGFPSSLLSPPPRR